MSRPKNPDALRERARRLVEEAKRLERERDDQRRRLLAELVLGHWEAGFQRFDAGAFRAEVGKIMDGPAGPRTQAPALGAGEG